MRGFLDAMSFATGVSCAKGRLTVAVAALAVLAACQKSAPRDVAAARQAATAQCSGTDPHTRHVNQFACETCHPKGGEFGFSGTLASGFAVSGTVTRVVGTPTSCTVTCHAPGGVPQPIAWNAGPTTCTSCHAEMTAAGGSSHAPAGDRDACGRCHDLAQHTGGVVQLVGGMQPGTDAMCLRCHSGTGGTPGDDPAPVLVDWTDPYGDFHGDRSGTGYGGSLLAPFVRGEGPLACRTCHDEHASPNAFLLASVVNGSALPPATIDRAGVGAERLCEACHVGDRHAQCAACHLVDPRPVGAACLSCHGHDGNGWFPWPGGSPANYHDQTQNTSCAHCHDAWAKPIEYTPPVILQPGNELISVALGAGEATISWQTDEGATSFVEYGTSERNLVAGDAHITSQHSVRLTGLASDTTYTFRVRSSDVMRNVARSSVRSFLTPCSTCLPVSIPVANAGFETPITATTEQAGAWWRTPGSADYCGTFASAEMAGAAVLRIAAVPHDACDDVECWTDEGWGSASYTFPHADLDLGNTVTFDMRPKVLGPGSKVTLLLQAFDASGASLTDTANLKHVFDLVGYASPQSDGSLRISSPVVDTTYAVTVPLRAAVAAGLVAGKTWAEVAKVSLTLQATSGGLRVDVFFDAFR